MALDSAVWPLLKVGRGSHKILLLHGFLGVKEDWLPLIEKLPANQLEVIAFDLPGHGSHTNVRTIPSFVQLLDELDRQRALLGIDRWHVAGYSMGGRIAIHYASRFPAHCLSLSVIAASPGLEGEAERRARIQRDAEWAAALRAGPMIGFLEKWYQQPIFASLKLRPALLGELQNSRLGNHADLAANALEAWGQGVVPPSWAALKTLPVPVRFIGGELDVGFKEIAAKLKSLLPGVVVDRLDGVGHAVPMEAPDLCAASVLENIFRKKL